MPCYKTPGMQHSLLEYTWCIHLHFTCLQIRNWWALDRIDWNFLSFPCKCPSCMHRKVFLFEPPPRMEALLVENNSLRGSPAPCLTHVLEWKSSSVWITPFLKESCWLEPFWTGSPVKLQCFLTCCITPTMQVKPCTVWKPSNKGNPVLCQLLALPQTDIA